jgi:hypothetical protein
MKKERKEIEPGIFAQVEICSKCKDDWIDEKEYSRLYKLFRRKAFKVGGSIAVRIPKEISDAIPIHDGDEVSFKVSKGKIIIEPT